MPQVRKRGQRPRLTPQLSAGLLEGIASGLPFDTACHLMGVNPILVCEWRQRGEGTHPTRPCTPLYAEFAEALAHARASDVARRVLRIEQAAKGGAVIYRKTTTHRDGSVTTEERVSEPAYQADCWHLERSHPKDWRQQNSVDVHVMIQAIAARVAAEHGLSVEDVLAEAQTMLTEADRAPALLGPPTR